MPVPSDTQLINFEGWTLRVRAGNKEPARVLFLVHGWTGDENSMWVFANRLPRTYWILAARAPYVTKPGGYSWRPEADKPGSLPRLEDLMPAASDIVHLVDDYSRANGMAVKSFDAIGFSQGAALVNTLALLHPDRVGRLGVLAGFVPAGAEKVIQSRPLEGKPFFVAHGTQDERVDVERARQSIELLEQAGARVTYCEDDVGHKVSASCLRALEAFFA